MTGTTAIFYTVSVAAISAPRSSRNLTDLTFPAWAANINGVMSKSYEIRNSVLDRVYDVTEINKDWDALQTSVRVLIETPLSISLFITSSAPYFAAKCIRLCGESVDLVSTSKRYVISALWPLLVAMSSGDSPVCVCLRSERWRS